jgi:hypothetical protein
MICVFLLWLIGGIVVIVSFLLVYSGFENISGFHRLNGNTYMYGGMRCRIKNNSASIWMPCWLSHSISL